jgi:hypothetical protein
MFKLIVSSALAATLAVAALPAFADSSYGTQNYGYGPHVPTRSLTPFERSWNVNNQGKRQARASADWMRRHHRQFPTPF